MSMPVFLPVLGLAVATSVTAGIYKWTDDQGNIHYGEHPPPGSEVREMKSAAPPGDEQVTHERERWDRIRERQERSDALRREDRERRDQEEAERKQQELERKRMCARARSNLHVLERQRPVFTIDDRGERVFVDAQQRASEIARLKALIEEHCG